MTHILHYRNKNHSIFIKTLYVQLTITLIINISISSTMPAYALSDLGRVALFTTPDISAVKSRPLKVEDPVLNTAKGQLTIEQVKNYIAEYNRIQRIVDLVYEDIPKEQKRCWQLLLIGTVAVESNFLDKYSGKSPNGNGPYQITGNTAYGIIHRYITYPIKGSLSVGERKELMPLFEKATDGRVTWDKLVKMDRSQLIELCVRDYDFSALISLLIYRETFARNGIKTIPLDTEGLAKLWKEYYNTSQGQGTVERFVERFHTLYKPIPEQPTS